MIHSKSHFYHFPATNSTFCLDGTIGLHVDAQSNAFLQQITRYSQLKRLRFRCGSRTVGPSGGSGRSRRWWRRTRRRRPPPRWPPPQPPPPTAAVPPTITKSRTSCWAAPAAAQGTKVGQIGLLLVQGARGTDFVYMKVGCSG